MTASAKNVIIVELNEFSVDLLRLAISQISLPSIAKVLSFPCTNYVTQDTDKSGFLEPWSQWVSIHTALPSYIHQIKHLGDAPNLYFPQCWEILGKEHVSTGMWGIMNASRNNTPSASFFLPDPWTYSEKAYPNELNALLDLPRYLSKNYQNLKKAIIFTYTIKLFKFLCYSKNMYNIISESLKLLIHIARFPKKSFVFISYFEYLSTLLFIQYKKKYQPQCVFLFLNSLAHLQHHHWKDKTRITAEIQLGLKYIDKILTKLFTHFPNDAYILHNGLSQINTNHETPWVLYRQKDPVQFLNILKTKPIHVEQNMTHDGHAFFKSPAECLQAFHDLKNARMDNELLFHVEINPSNPTKLFYQLQFTKSLVDPLIEFMLDNQKYKFFNYFDKIVTRTGRHIQEGTIFSNTVLFPDNIANHDFNRYLYHYFLPKQYPLDQSSSLPKNQVTNEELA